MKTPLLGDRTFYRDVARIGLPVAMQNLLGTTAGMIDTAMIGSQGTLAVASVGVAAQFGALFSNCFVGFANGGTLFFSQYWGAKDHTGIKKSYGLMLVTMMLVSFLFCGLAMIAPQFVMSIYTDDPEIIALGAKYLRIVAASYPIQVMAVGISSMLRSTERVKLPLAASIASTATNIILNYLLIYGKLGFPQLGAVGAAIGTLASCCVNVIFLYIACIAKKEPYLLAVRDHYGWSAPFMKQYFVKCTPIILNEILYGVGMLFINMVLGRQNQYAIAVVAVFRSLEGLVFAFWGGLANASGIMVGKLVGAGKHLDGYTNGKRFALICPLLTCVITTTMFLLHEPLLKLFGMEGQSLEYGKWILLFYIFASSARTCNYLINTIYRVGGDPIYGTVVEVCGLLFVAVPAVWIVGMWLDAPFLWVFAMVFVDEPLRLAIQIPYLVSGKWIKPVTKEGIATLEEFRQLLHSSRKKKAA